VSDAVQKGLERAADFLATISGAAERAVANALNQAATLAREEAIAAIGQRYAVRPSDVREAITLRPATPSSLVISVVARSGPLSLTYFPHSPVDAGTGGRGKPMLRAEVLRGQMKDVPGAFIATINGKPRIMIRTGGRTATGKSAIKSVMAVPIAVMLGVESVERAVVARALGVFDERLDREIDKALGKAAS
jgi:hypothetical protein